MKITITITLLLLAQLSYTQNILIWTHEDPAQIERSNLDGSDRQVLISNNNLTNPYALCIEESEGKLYWSDLIEQKIQRSNIDGTNVEDIVLINGVPRGIGIDAASEIIYFTDTENKVLSKIKFDGSGFEELVVDTDLFTYPVGLRLDLENGKIYWSDTGKDMIRRANLDGTQVENIIEFADDNVIEDLELDLIEEKIYWTDIHLRLIQRSNLDGTAVETLLTVTDGLQRPEGITIDQSAGKMYWVDREAAKIQRANLDGTAIEDLIDSDLSLPHRILIHYKTISTAVQEPLIPEFTVFPNPATNQIQISTNLDTYDLSVFNSSGKLIERKISLNNLGYLDIKNYPKGIYLLLISHNNQIQTKKLIKY